jgi:hypothetical protein
VTGSNVFGMVLSASYALNALNLGTGSSYYITSSWASSSISSSYVQSTTSASYSLTSSYALNAPVGGTTLGSGSSYNITSSWATYSISSSYSTNSSFSSNSNLLNGTSSAFFATTGSNNFIGSQTVTGSLFSSGSNNLIGNTVISGNVIVSGSSGEFTPTIKIYGDIQTDGFIKLLPVDFNLDNSVSSSYIYVSGSTNDLYFSQNGAGFNSSTRLRWLEANLYTGLLHGGVISSTIGTNTFNVTSGSGIIVTLNALTSSSPYPTVKYLDWPSFLNQSLIYSGSSTVTYLGISSSGELIQQPTPWGNTSPTQWESDIHLGAVFHLSSSVSNAVLNNPQISYGFSVQVNDFVRSFGPMKLSGNVLQTSGSTLGIRKSAGSSFLIGSNYINDPNHPSTTTDNGVDNCKITRYYKSGSSFVVDRGPLGVGYSVIDNTKYVDTTTGLLVDVPSNRYTIQRVFWKPNTEAFFNVYYGNATYKSISEANIQYPLEVFSESTDTSESNIYLGHIIVNGGTITSLESTDALIVQSGLFRSVTGVGSSGGTTSVTTLNSLNDVSSSNLSNGDLLVYSGSVWRNSKSFSGSYQFTGSFDASVGSITGSLLGTASLSISASYALNAPNISTGSKYNITSSWATSSISSSYSTNSNTSLSASYVSSSGLFGTIVSSSYSNTSSVSLSSSNALYSTSGSYSLNSRSSLTSSYITSSNIVGIVDSSSYALTSLSASYVPSSPIESSSYASTSSWSEFAGTVESSSYALSGSYVEFASLSDSSSYALSASCAESSNAAGSSSFAISASSSDSSSVSLSSSFSDYSLSSSYSETSSYAVTSSWSEFSSTSSYVTGSVVLETSAAPAQTDPGLVGEIRYDDNYIYIFTNGFGWKRSSLSLY